jgi:hypothetical protein
MNPFQDSLDRIRELAQTIAAASTKKYPTYTVVDVRDSAIAEALIYIAAALESLKGEAHDPPQR